MRPGQGHIRLKATCESPGKGAITSGARADSAFLERADRTAVGVLLGHLLGEEHVFDFSAGRIQRKESRP